MAAARASRYKKTGSAKLKLDFEYIVHLRELLADRNVRYD